MESERRLSRNLSPLGAWAFSIGTSIGWGSLVVTSNTYLAQAGPWGSTFGTVIGGLVMLIIGANYAYLMNVHPEAGGAYTYASKLLGHDYGFLTAWFLALTYLAILWANATSIPLFARYFIGDAFRFGHLYSFFGYEVFLGEVLLSIGAILIVAFLCVRGKRAMAAAMIVLAVAFSAGITVCFLIAILRRGGVPAPGYVPDSPAFSQIVRIAVISPWAFIGFENISHAGEETRFPRTQLQKVLLISVISTTVLYVFVILLSVTAFPPEYSSWLDYIRDRENLDGLKGLPAFYAANHYMGAAGVATLMVALLALIITSLIGNITALSRLFYALGRDKVLPARFGELNSRCVPDRAVGLVAAVSVFFPFLGRTAIGWIVDVTTIGATLIYGLVSASALRLARKRWDKREQVLGGLGVALMTGFMLYLLVPNLYTSGSMARESYFFFIVWAVLGFIYFRGLLNSDSEHRYGKSIVVWISLFSLILFVSLVFLFQTVLETTDEGMRYIEQVYTQEGVQEIQKELVNRQMAQVRRVSGISVTAVLALIALSLVMLVGNFRKISERAQSSEHQLGVVQEMANRDPLTGVKSMRAYAEREKEMDELIDSGQAEAFGVVLCDLNGLKHVNDTLGHKAGDELIKSASRVICSLFSHSPVYRSGGDEFVVVLTGHDYGLRNELMDALRQQSETNIGTDGAVISAGLSEFQKDADHSVRPVFDRADAAMYEEKKRLKQLGAATR